MWAEFIAAIAEGRAGSADFTDGVRDSAVIDALYAAAASGTRTAGRRCRPGSETDGETVTTVDEPPPEPPVLPDAASGWPVTDDRVAEALRPGERGLARAASRAKDAARRRTRCS